MTDKERDATAKRLYELKLFETLYIHDYTAFALAGPPTICTRVPGGWIYNDARKNSVFIPYDSEFDPNAN